jgi:hypothetical protein
MKKKNKPLLDDYLESVKDMEEAATDPFFYTRLYERSLDSNRSCTIAAAKRIYGH